MGFSRQECWSGLPFPSPGHLPDPGIESMSPALQANFYHWGSLSLVLRQGDVRCFSPWLVSAEAGESSAGGLWAWAVAPPHVPWVTQPPRPGLLPSLAPATLRRPALCPALGWALELLQVNERDLK